MRAQQILGQHPVVRAIVSAAERLAGSGRAVAMIGERGTGKELLARHVHAAAGLPDERFVRIDCAESAPGRLEHELFEREGGWWRAGGGTLLLDDLPRLPIDLQQRLVGRRATADAEASQRGPQLVASLDQEVGPACRAGRLDTALIDHLRPVEIVLPALRQRRCDIPLLVQHFLSRYAERHGLPPRVIETDALVHFWQYDWPGNVRELESVIERLVVLCSRGIIRSADLPAHVRAGIGERAAGPLAATSASGIGGPQLRPTI